MRADPATLPLFTTADAERVVGTPASTARRWLDGYSYIYKGERRTRGPRLGPTATQLEGVLLMSFLDLIEVRMARILRGRRVPWRQVDLTAAFFRREWGSEHPFGLERFRSDGRRVFAELGRETGNHKLLEIGSNQYVFDAVVAEFLSDVLDFREDGIPWRLWPNGRDGLVVVDPARAFGQPILHNQGVPIRVILAAYAANDNDITKVARWFDLPPPDVEAAVRFAATRRLAA